MTAPASPTVTAKNVAVGVVSLLIGSVAGAATYRIDSGGITIATISSVAAPYLDRFADEGINATYTVYAINAGLEASAGTAVTIQTWIGERTVSPTSAERHARHG